MNGRAQRAVITGVESRWRSIVSGIPQRPVLGSFLFSLSINNLDKEIECILGKFVDAMKIREVADTPEGCPGIQQDPDRLWIWAERNSGVHQGQI